jgi:hypothetical protein
VKYSPAGSGIAIAGRVKDGQVALAVTDPGVGLTEEGGVISSGGLTVGDATSAMYQGSASGSGLPGYSLPRMAVRFPRRPRHRPGNHDVSSPSDCSQHCTGTGVVERCPKRLTGS